MRCVMNKPVRYSLNFIRALIFSLCITALAVADERPLLSTDPGDTPLVIRGTLDKQTTSFGGNVRLTITGGKAETLRLLPSDMRHSIDAGVVIDRSNVTIPAGIKLDNNHPYDVRVTISNVKQPGKYIGKLKFLLPNQTRGLIIPLEMNIDASPDVVPVTPDMALQVTRCQNPFDCALAGWLLPESMIRNDWLVQLDNHTPLPVEIVTVVPVMRGDKTGIVLSAREVSLTMPDKLPPGQVESVGLNIHRSKLAPDRYKGILRFRFKGSDTPVNVNLVLDVRNGPLLPILIILLGIMLGRLARSMETPEAKSQLKLYPGYLRLEADAKSVENTDAFEYLEKKLKVFKKSLDTGKETEDALTRALDNIDAQINFLHSLEDLEKQLKELELDAIAEELGAQFAEAREALLAENRDRAEEIRCQIDVRLQELQKDKTMGEATDFITALLSKFQNSSTHLVADQHSPVPAHPGGSRWGWLARLLSSLAGSQSISIEVRFWLIRPLLFLILLAILALLGLQTLYINAGATFGVSGLYDYLGLFLWGLTADVAQRTLQNTGEIKQ